MKKLQSILESPWAISFGETILHSLWQGAVILVIYLLLAKKWKNPKTKVNLGLFALFSQFFASGITLYFVFNSHIGTAVSQIFLVETASSEFSISHWVTANSPYLFAAWLFGFSFLSIKYTFSLAYVQYLKHSHQNTLSKKASSAWHNLTKKVSIEGFRIQIFESSKVSTAMVIGYLKPIILLPLTMVSHLTSEQLEVILAHELAHIKRNDFAINLFQTLVESIYFFHPIYWFVGSQIRENRELACDGLAADWTGKGILLAKTLAKLQLAQSQPEFAMAFGKKKMSTLLRIENLLGYQNKNQKSRFFAIIFMCSMILAFGFVSKNESEIPNKNQEIQIIEDEILSLITPSLPITSIDTNITRNTVEQTIHKEEVNIKTDNYDVNIDQNGILLNGKRVDMSPAEREDFNLKWQNFQKSQREIETMSRAIELESSKIEAIHKDFDFSFDPIDDPDFKVYVAAIEKSSEQLGKVASKMSEEIMKLDRHDKDYDTKAEEITKSYSQKMQRFQKEIQKQQPKMEKWQANMESKQKEFEKQMEKAPIVELEAKLEKQAKAIDKVAERMEAEHSSLLDLLPKEVKNEIENGEHIYMNYPSAPPAPPMPPAVNKVPRPTTVPQPVNPPSPQKTIKD